MKMVKSMTAAIAMIAMAVIVLYKAGHQGNAKVADRKIPDETQTVVDQREYIHKMGQGSEEAWKKVTRPNLKQDVSATEPVSLSGKKTRQEKAAKPAGAKNEWKGKIAGDAKKKKRYHVTPSEKRLLAKAVYGEARGESFQGQVAVAAVILNRTEHAAFPDSVHGVIYQENAFTAVEDGQIHLEPDEKAVRAVETAIQGEDPTRGAVYYYNPDIATSEWMKKKAMKSSKLRIGEHVFFK